MKKVVLLLSYISLFSLESMASPVYQAYSCVSQDAGQEKATLEINFNPSGADTQSILIFRSKTHGVCESSVGFNTGSGQSGGVLYSPNFYRHSTGGSCQTEGDIHIAWAGKLQTRTDKKVKLTKITGQGGKQTFACSLVNHQVIR